MRRIDDYNPREPQHWRRLVSATRSVAAARFMELRPFPIQFSNRVSDRAVAISVLGKPCEFV
jgi:hypothetical protein